eukprot:scaffold31527_cov37-Tisochrysis_lutea.AAC.1
MAAAGQRLARGRCGGPRPRRPGSPGLLWSRPDELEDRPPRRVGLELVLGQTVRRGAKGTVLRLSLARHLAVLRRVTGEVALDPARLERVRVVERQ